MAGVLKVGLTGGIACGRSTVARILSAQGIHVLDADRVAHALLAEDRRAIERVVREFGEEVRAAGGGVDRAALGKVVFTDPAARRKLEAILHPRILEVLDADIESFARRPASGIVVVDAALMVETRTYARYHRLVVVHCPPQVQLARLMERDGLAEEEASARIAAQAPLASKIALADYLIDSGGTLERTREETLRVLADLRDDQRDLPALKPRRRGGAAC